MEFRASLTTYHLQQFCNYKNSSTAKNEQQISSTAVVNETHIVSVASKERTKFFTFFSTLMICCCSFNSKGQIAFIPLHHSILTVFLTLTDKKNRRLELSNKTVIFIYSMPLILFMTKLASTPPMAILKRPVDW